MIRALVIIVVAGFLTSVACLTAAVAIGGPEAVARGAWAWRWDHDWDDGPHVWRQMSNEAGPGNAREFPWTGDRLEVNAPAEVNYVQAAGPPKLLIRAPARVLDRVRVEGGRISLDGGRAHGSELHITLTAPNVTRFELNGADRLTISGYKQDELRLAASGHAEIKAQGEVKTVRLSISGHGEADLAELKTTGAAIAISGAGEASAAPTEWAEVQISGLGEVDLLTRPKRLDSQISGAGRVRQPDDPASADRDDEERNGPAQRT